MNDVLFLIKEDFKGFFCLSWTIAVNTQNELQYNKYRHWRPSLALFDKVT